MPVGLVLEFKTLILTCSLIEVMKSQPTKNQAKNLHRAAWYQPFLHFSRYFYLVVILTFVPDYLELESIHVGLIEATDWGNEKSATKNQAKNLHCAATWNRIFWETSIRLWFYFAQKVQVLGNLLIFFLMPPLILTCSLIEVMKSRPPKTKPKICTAMLEFNFFFIFQDIST